jgi:hypothetical protein
VQISCRIMMFNVVLNSYFRGTQNQATLKFRNDGSFELHWSGIFGYSEYFTGSYLRRGDTFFLNYDKNAPSRFGRRILKQNGFLSSLDTLQKEIRYVEFRILND